MSFFFHSVSTADLRKVSGVRREPVAGLSPHSWFSQIQPTLKDSNLERAEYLNLQGVRFIQRAVTKTRPDWCQNVNI